jgi:uncharacterized membrane protein YdjX (TVP38/TMEM64 family)
MVAELGRILRWLAGQRRVMLALLLWAIVAGSSRQLMAAQNLTFQDAAEQIAGLLRGSWIGIVIYIGVYVLRPLILFPASLLTVLGGSVFGLVPGFLVALLAGTVSALVPYSLGRWFAAGQRSGDTILQRFVQVLQRNPFQAVLLMRLVYLPYDAVSVLAGSLRIPWWAFLGATALGNIAGTFAFVGIGASIEGDLASGEIRLNAWMLGFSALVMIGSIVVSVALRRREQVAAGNRV